MAISSMSGGSYLRNDAGAKTLKNTSFASDIQKIKKALDASHMNNLAKVTRQYWVGADATDFINDVNATRNKILQQISSLQSQFNSAIDGDAREFASFQSKNVK